MDHVEPHDVDPSWKMPLASIASSVHELGRVDWPRRTVLQHSAVVLAVLVLLISLVLAVDAGGTALLTWVTG